MRKMDYGCINAKDDVRRERERERETRVRISRGLVEIL